MMLNDVRTMLNNDIYEKREYSRCFYTTIDFCLDPLE